MFGAVYLIVPSLAGFCLLSRWMPGTPALVRLMGGFLSGTVVSSWLTYIFAAGLSGQTDSSLKVGMWVTVVTSIGLVGWSGRLLLWRALAVSPSEVVAALASLGFSHWLMVQRLQADPNTAKHELVVSANTWGDWALHLAEARSFSAGANYPTEYPFFANVPIRYHFGYDFYMGALQDGGMSVLQSFRLPAELAFACMMMLVYSLARMIFAPKQQTWLPHRGDWIGLIATLLLITNQSVEWLRYVRTDAHGNFLKALNPDLLQAHKGYLVTGYYNGADAVPNYVTLNEYLTENHQIIAVSVCLFLSYLLLEQLRGHPRLGFGRALFIGVLLGLSLWINAMVWLAALVFFTTLLLIFAGFAIGARVRASQLVKTDSESSVPLESPYAELRNDEPLGIDLATAPALPDTQQALPEALQRPERPPTVRAETIAWLKAAALLIGPSALLGLAQLLWLSAGGAPQKNDFIHIGYLVCNWDSAPCHKSGQMDVFSLIDWGSFLQYWWLSRGLALPLLVLAFVAGRHFDKKVITAASAVFIVASMVQLNPDLGGSGHKLINVWATLTDLFVAAAVVQICEFGWALYSRGTRGQESQDLLTRRTLISAGVLSWLCVPAIIFVLLASGVVDFMTIKNDFKVAVFGDDTQEAAISWIASDTPKRAVFLTNYGDLYTAPTLAGRGIYLGYVPWVETAGYDSKPRIAVTQQIYSASSHDEACRLLKRNGIDYVQIGPSERSLDKDPAQRNFVLNEALFRNSFVSAHSVTGDGEGHGFDYYDVAKSCRGVS